jgi:hypothetical protein
MEKDELLERWDVLVNEYINVDQENKRAAQTMLQERLAILHRLNELGEYVIEGIPIGQALEETNARLREVDRLGRPVSTANF